MLQISFAVSLLSNIVYRRHTTHFSSVLFTTQHHVSIFLRYNILIFQVHILSPFLKYFQSFCSEIVICPLFTGDNLGMERITLGGAMGWLRSPYI